MNHHSLFSLKKKLWLIWLFAGLLLFFALVWKTRWIDLPHYESKGSIRLSILAEAPGFPDKNNLWLVELVKGKIEYQNIATLEGVVGFVNCSHLPATLCVANLDSTARLEKLYYYRVAQGSEIISNTIELPASIRNFDAARVIAITPEGILTTGSQGFQIHLENQIRPTTLYFSDNNGCMKYKFSPNREWLAILCLGNDWITAGRHPFEPTQQHIDLVKLDGSEHQTLNTSPTFFFDEFYLMEDAVPIGPPVPDFEWAPDSDEIAFVTSFLPPQKLTFPRLLIPGIGTYDVYGGIYSTSITKGKLLEWANIGSGMGAGNAILAWSPDQQYMAYSLDGNLYITSRQGKHRKVHAPDDIYIENNGVVSWSPDGDYIAVISQDGSIHNNIWILSTQDYSWQRLDIPPDIKDMIWVSAALP